MAKIHSSEPTGISPLRAVYKTLSTGKLALQGIDIPCAVIEGPDKKPVRVLSRKKLQQCIGITTTAVQPDDPATGLPHFLAAESRFNPMLCELKALATPLWYQSSRGGALSAGYSADLLPAICEAYIFAFQAGTLHPHQDPIFRRCLAIQSAFARLGITALVDEVTGYQADRERDALRQLIQLYLADTPLPWVRTFPREFYAEAYRLHQLRYTPGQTTHPAIIGAFTKQTIYDWLPPDVYAELCARNPRVHGPNTSWRMHKHHQHLTEDVGRQHVVNRLQLVLHLMRSANGNLPLFWAILESGRPHSQVVMPFYLEDNLFSEKG